MKTYRCVASLLSVILLVLIPPIYSWAQESESDVELFRKAEQDLLLLNEKDRQDIESARKVEAQLWGILKHYPNSTIRKQVEEALIRAQEILAGRNLNLAYLILGRSKLSNLDMQAAEFRFVKVIYECPKFSRRDEALLSLAKLYLKWGRNADATKYLQILVCSYPSSQYVGEASEQLNKIGVSASEGCAKLSPE